jgi:hypothetical protein
VVQIVVIIVVLDVIFNFPLPRGDEVELGHSLLASL